MAGDRRAPMAASDDEVMPVGFSPDRFIDGAIEKIVAFGSSETLMRRQRIDQRHDAAPHQRLVAGERKLADPRAAKAEQ